MRIVNSLLGFGGHGPLETFAKTNPQLASSPVFKLLDSVHITRGEEEA